MRYSQHSISRTKQRGIPRDLLDIVYRYGRTRYANGASITDMDSDGIHSYLTDEPTAHKQKIDKLSKLYRVDADENLITAGRKNTRFKRKFK